MLCSSYFRFPNWGINTNLQYIFGYTILGYHYQIGVPIPNRGTNSKLEYKLQIGVPIPFQFRGTNYCGTNLLPNLELVHTLISNWCTNFLIGLTILEWGANFLVWVPIVSLGYHYQTGVSFTT